LLKIINIVFHLFINGFIVSKVKFNYYKNIQKVKEIYNWENQEKILLDVYKKL